MKPRTMRKKIDDFQDREEVYPLFSSHDEDKIFVASEPPPAYDPSIYNKGKSGVDIETLSEFYRFEGKEFNKKMKFVSAQEHFAQEGVEYTNGVVASKYFLESFWNQTKQGDMPSFIENLMFSRNSASNLVLCDMGHGIGKGVFLRPGARPIPPGVPVIVYSGRLKRNLGSVDFGMSRGGNNFEFVNTIAFNDSDYSFRSGSDVFPQTRCSGYNTCFVDAEKHGNLSRYINHAPRAESLSAMDDPDNIKNKIQVSNLDVEEVSWNGGFVHFFFSREWIYPGMQLTIDYQKNYWKTRSRDPYVLDFENRPLGRVVDMETLRILPERQKHLVPDRIVDKQSCPHVKPEVKARNLVHPRLRFEQELKHLYETTLKVVPGDKTTTFLLCSLIKRLELSGVNSYMALKSLSKGIHFALKNEFVANRLKIMEEQYSRSESKTSSHVYSGNYNCLCYGTGSLFSKPKAPHGPFRDGYNFFNGKDCLYMDITDRKFEPKANMADAEDNKTKSII